MTILAIETSCDDTGIALLKVSGIKRPRFVLLSNIISSQVKIHQKWGGVYPTMAKREHQRNLVPVLRKSLEKADLLEKVQNPRLSGGQATPSGGQATPSGGQANAKVKTLGKILEREEILLKLSEKFLAQNQKPKKIDAIAVTAGPGLEPCLWVGVNFARALAYYWNLPIIPVNHIEGHIFANWLTPISENSKSEILNPKPEDTFPAVCLVVSGGHTQLILMKNLGKYKILGETRDDAAGECFDKAARVLGLGYPGGPTIAWQAEQWKSRNPSSQLNINLPRPMMHSKDYDFSFSGLKTAVLYDFKKRTPTTKKNKNYIQEMCAETQQAIIDVLVRKTIKATENYKAKSVILGGGVAANRELRDQLKSKVEGLNPKVIFRVPPQKLCTDNAAMIALAAHFQGKKTTWRKVKADANIRIN